MTDRDQLIEWLDLQLDTDHFNQVEDADFNGALIKGSEEVEKVGLCTNTTFENISKAEENNCDLVIVHHGGWKHFDKDLLEDKKQAIREADLTWYIAHQTLDCADEYGVCVALADKLGVEVNGKYLDIEGGYHGRYGHLKVSSQEFLNRLKEIEPNYEVVGKLENIEDAKIGIVGGGGGTRHNIIQKTLETGCDLFITGNSLFLTDIYAYEKGLNMITLEETSSEKWGVYALGDKLEQYFSDLEIVKIKEKNW